MDPRHLKRIKIVQNLYAFSFNKHKTAAASDKLGSNLPYPEETKTPKIIAKLGAIDQLIKKYAPRYPLDNIARTDLSILRMSVYELIYERKTPQKVAINEAVELAKELSGENSFAFINAVLGKILNQLPNPSKDEKP